MKPLAQIGFMPEALSSKPQPYKHSWRPGAPIKKLLQDGLIRQMIITNGEN